MTATDGQIATGADPVSQRNGIGDPVPPSPSSSMVRGACPSLAAPMPTGDGLLVRLRPSTPGLTIGQFRDLALAVIRHGNGLLEITARGNIQLRGLSSETMPDLAADIARAGIVPEAGLTIETPPLSGRDPTETADARGMAQRLRRALAALPMVLKLAPKLTIIIDGGGDFGLDELSADIRLRALASDRWQLSVGGTQQSSLTVAAGGAEDVLPGVIDLLKSLAALGPRARGRDLATTLPHRQSDELPAQKGSLSSRSPIGLHRLGPDTTLLGIVPRYGQISADKLLALLDAAELAGVEEIRPSPSHALLLLGGSSRIASLPPAAIELGFDVDANAPSSRIASCSGAGACASATYRTRDLAADVVEWAPALLDGSIGLHLSGCPKGCAHPTAADIAIVGSASGLAVVLDGIADGEPVLVTDKIGVKSALQRLAALVGDSKGAHESVKACLKRLGGNAIAAVLRQE